MSVYDDKAEVLRQLEAAHQLRMEELQDQLAGANDWRARRRIRRLLRRERLRFSAEMVQLRQSGDGTISHLE
jgi:hypothetical protein